MGAMSSAFCAEVPNNSRHATMTVSRVTTAHPAKCVDVWMIDRQISQVQLAAEHLIHNL
jgi:hypothetical protein